MGFNTVYRVLQEIFPHVAEFDARLLRAVAVEHRKDADAAVEAVLTEIIPYLSERTKAADFSSESGIVPSSFEGAVIDANTSGRSDDVLVADSTGLDEAINGSAFYDANDGNSQVCGGDGNDELVSLDKCDEIITKVGSDMSSNATFTNLIDENIANESYNLKDGSTESENIMSLSKYEESRPIVGSDQSSHVSSTDLECGYYYANGKMDGSVHGDMKDFDGPAGCEPETAVRGESHQEQSYMDGNLLELQNSMVLVAASPVQEYIQNVPESSLELVPMPDIETADVEQPEPSDSFDSASKKYISTSEVVEIDGDSTLNTVITRYLLEDIIEDARNNKKTLFSGMESVINLMRKVELEEKAVEDAKEGAARGGLELLTRVEDLKQMLQHAKEANDMHAGEVYGEKSILATEVRELQSRVLSLFEEREKSLAVLDEMRQTLEVRLAEVEKVRKAAEHERLEKEESARKALANQELIMEKVVQESKILRQEAEENSKLREFLMDRGRVVDMLQGEISVICQDVKLLKEKFDDRVPLSKSLSSSQTSCILASSSSSLKSVAPDQVPEQAADLSETPKNTSPTPSIHVQLTYGDESAGDDHKALVEDGWELFDKREFYM